MEKEKINDYVRNRRTQARLVNNIVDPSLINVSTPYMQDIYSSIDNIAKKYEAFQLENEKNNIMLKMEQMEQEYNNKFLQDPLTFTDQDKFEGAIKAYKDLSIAKNDLLKTSKYLTRQDVDEFLRQNTRVAGDTLTSMGAKRNQMYIKDVQDTAMLNLKQMEDYGTTLSLRDKARMEQVQNGIKRTYQALVETGINPLKASAIVGNSLANIQYSAFNKDILEMAQNSNIPPMERLNQIRAYKEQMGKETTTQTILNDLTKDYDFTDEQKEALRMELQTRGNKIKNNQDRELERIIYDVKREQKNIEVQNRKLKQIGTKYERDKKAYDRMLEKGNVFDYADKEYNIVMDTTDVINDNKILNDAYQLDIKNLGDANDPRVIEVVSSGDMSDLKTKIVNAKAEGATTQDVASILYDFATEKSGGDSYKRTAILKDLGNRVSGFSPNILIRGEQDPRYFSVDDTYKKAKQEFDIDETRLKTETWYRTGTKQRYEQLALASNANSVAYKRKLDRFIVGYILKNGVSKQAEAIRNGQIDIVVNQFLKDDDNFNALMDEMDIFKNTYIQATPYQNIKLNPKNRKFTKETQMQDVQDIKDIVEEGYKNGNEGTSDDFGFSF